jgi:hypothetical protein
MLDSAGLKTGLEKMAAPAARREVAETLAFAAEVAHLRASLGVSEPCCGGKA